MNPHKFRGVVYFDYKNDNVVLEKDIIEKIIASFSQAKADRFETQKNTLSFYSYKSLFNLEHKVEITVFTETDQRIEYVFDFGELYKTTLLISLFALFFIKFSWWIFLIAAGVITIGLITLNISLLNGHIKNTIVSSLSDLLILDDTLIPQDQKNWIKNPEKCPACGADITEYNKKCLSCGLKVDGKKIKSNTNISSPEFSVKYHFNKNEK